MIPGQLLARLSAAPALVLAAWLLVGVPLLLAGAFRPLPAVALFVPVACVALWWGVRKVPGRLTAPWWAVAGVVVVAVGFGVLQALMASEQIVVRRDAASYAQFTIWLAEHGSLPIPRFAGVFGHDQWLSYGSPAFYERGDSIFPQFMAGLPLILAPGHWVAGLSGVLLGPTVLGAAGVLTFGGFIARLVGAKWAPLGALALAVSWPIVYVSRSTYSEAAALILLVGGLLLLVDALDLRDRHRAARAGLAGLVLGITVLVRVDALRDVLPLVPYAGVLVLRRSPLAFPLAGGLSVGVIYGLTEGYLLSWPYLEHLAPALHPLLAISAGAVVATVVIVAGVFWMYRSGRPPAVDVSRFRLPEVTGALVVLAVAGFAVRPWLQETHTDTEATARFVGELQEFYGLPVDPTRLYYENSLHWLIWYVGVPAILLATFAAALLAWFAGRGRAPRWVPVLAVLLWTTGTVLWYPGITPDHPWASRRFAPLVIPAMILLAVWGLAWLARYVHRHAWRRWAVTGMATAGSIAIALPPVLTSLPLMFAPIEQGEAAAVRRVCRSLHPDAAVVFLDPLAAARFLQVVRGMCDVPTVQLNDPSVRRVSEVVARVSASGNRPVLASWYAETLHEYTDSRPVRVLDLETRRDTSVLTRPPGDTLTLEMTLWIVRPTTPVAGAE